MKLKLLLIIPVLIVLTSCHQNASEKYEGTLTIYADINQQKFMNQFVPVFENIYPKSKLIFQYLDAQRLLQLYFLDSISNVILSRDLSPNEITYANQHRRTVSKQYYFADDAIAIIGNKNSKDSIFNFQSNKKTIVISEYTKSYFQQLSITDSAKNIYALKTPEDVIKYVSENDAIGLIPFSTFSNDRDKKHLALREQIRLLQYQKNDSVYKLSQSSISDFSYPLVTHTVLVTPKYPEPFLKLFSLFLFRDRAARMILHYGLVPAKLPELKVELKNKNYVIEK